MTDFCKYGDCSAEVAGIDSSRHGLPWRSIFKF